MNRRKIITFVVSGVVTIILCFLCLNIYHIVQVKLNAVQQSKNIPAVSFYSLKGEIMSLSQQATQADTLIINLFHPECEHCQYMASTFQEHIPKLKHTRIVMISQADSVDISNFSNTYRLSDMCNLVVLQDKRFQFNKFFGTSVVPSFFIYANGRLIKKIIGETKFANLF